MRRKTIIRILTVCTIIYALIGIVYFHAQERILFRPVVVDSDFNYDFPMPFRETIIPHHPGADLHITIFPVSNDIGRKGIVIYLHGNQENVSWYVDRVPYFTARGYEVWMPDYPGYGKSTGPLEESLFYEYARQAYLMAKADCVPDSIWVYGRSMGTGVAAWLASKVSVRGLVLETPYQSIPELVSTWMPIWPTRRLSRFKFPVSEYLQQVAEPVTIFQGTDDRVNPWSQAAGLKTVLKPGDRFVTIDGGRHNDLPTYPLYTRMLDTLFTLQE